jgi:hypothetical protein
LYVWYNRIAMTAANPLDRRGAQNNSDPRPSGIFVAVAIITTIAMLVAMLVLLAMRAASQRAPAMALIVQGDERWRGVSLVVQGPGLANPLKSTLDKSNKYVVSFFLDPGSYHLYVRDGSRDMFDQDLTLDNNVDTIGFDLSHSNLTPPTTKPSGAPKS